MLRRGDRCIDIVWADPDQAVGVADEDVSGVDDYAADGDGAVDAACLDLGGLADANTAGEDGDCGGGDFLAVTHGAVDDERCKPAFLRGKGQHVAPGPGLGVALGVDDEDVPFAGFQERNVDEPVVPRFKFYCHGTACNFGAGVEGFDGG